jgi:hypothetical protein
MVEGTPAGRNESGDWIGSRKIAFGIEQGRPMLLLELSYHHVSISF